MFEYIFINVHELKGKTVSRTFWLDNNVNNHFIAEVGDSCEYLRHEIVLHTTLHYEVYIVISVCGSRIAARRARRYTVLYPGVLTREYTEKYIVLVI